MDLASDFVTTGVVAYAVANVTVVAAKFVERTTRNAIIKLSRTTRNTVLKLSLKMRRSCSGINKTTSDDKVTTIKKSKKSKRGEVVKTPIRTKRKTQGQPSTRYITVAV